MSRLRKRPMAKSAFCKRVVDGQQISCSRNRNSSVSKKSESEISQPSHSSLIVTIPGFLLSPFMMLFNVDGGTAERFANAFNDMFFSRHNCSIRLATQSLVFIFIPPVQGTIAFLQNWNGRYIDFLDDISYNVHLGDEEMLFVQHRLSGGNI